MSLAAVDSPLLERILRGFRTDAHVRERLPGGGILNIDRKLPCLFVYRQPPDRPDAGTQRLVAGEAAYLIARDDADQAAAIVAALAETATAELGSCMIVEVWTGDDDAKDFIIHAPRGGATRSTDTLERELGSLPTHGIHASVLIDRTDARHPPDLPPLLSARECFEIGCLLVGLQVPPIFRDAVTGTIYPVFLRRLRSLLSRAFRQAAFEFARVQTTTGVESYHALGPRSFGSELTDADHELAELEASFELLLLVSPINSNEEWARFRDAGYTCVPEFRYRLLPVDPDALKRRLFAIDLEPIEDPALAFILRDKREELDRQISLLADRNTDTFRYGSARLYGAVDPLLLGVAREILETIEPPRHAAAESTISAASFAHHAHAELDHYRAQYPDLAAEVQVRPDLVGLMVSRGNLLIGDRLSIRPARLAPLLHHEVGTHVLTWYNGAAQPLRQLATGLAGYDELQEGLAVFAEYLAGGLDASRMRVLAGRVVAAHSVEHGAGFLETFRLLTDHGFSAGTAFDISERVHQCGGFTRDMIYLRGLLGLVEYLRAGGVLESLYIGKIAAKHVEIIVELSARGFLRAPPMQPRLFDSPETAERIAAVRRGLSITHMIGTTE
jgi:uncharacterized protein (TIGR02421 family)